MGDALCFRCWLQQTGDPITMLASLRKNTFIYKRGNKHRCIVGTVRMKRPDKIASADFLTNTFKNRVELVKRKTRSTIKPRSTCTRFRNVAYQSDRALIVINAILHKTILKFRTKFNVIDHK